jgi:excisionase family DNA binding protein
MQQISQQLQLQQPQPTAFPNYWRKAPLARALKVSVRTLDRRIAAGEIEARKFGAVTLIPDEAVRRLMADMPARPIAA